MERMHQSPKKTQQTPSSFIQRSNLVQRKCACGGIAGVDDLYEQGQSKRLNRSQSHNLTKPSWLASLEHVMPGNSHQPIEVTQQLSGGSRFGHDLSQIPVHADASGSIQAKLNISRPGDRYEQEADRVAEQVMRMPDSDAMQNVRSSDYPLPIHIQWLAPQAEEAYRQPDEEEEKDETLQAKEAPGHAPVVTPELQTRIHSLQGGGQPLSEVTRAFMESRFGHDFSQVRVHADKRAAESARAMNARAYTVGRDVVFGEGQFSPLTDEGAQLMAHELVHYLQQNGSQSSAALLVQRFPDDKGGIEGKGGKEIEKKVAEQKEFPASLTGAQRIELRRIAGDNITMAYTDFVDAANRNRESVKAAINAEAAWAGVLMEIAMGFLAPGIARGIARLAGALPVKASNTAYRLALAALDTSRTNLILTSATKVGKQVLQSNATALFGETETDGFINLLKKLYRQAFTAINYNLSNLTDVELGVIATIYDPSVSNSDTYAPIIELWTKRFREQILPIGKRYTYSPPLRFGGGVRQGHLFLACWIASNDGKRLALLDKGTIAYTGWRYRFITWISPEFEKLAISKTEDLGLSVETVAGSEVFDLPVRK